MRILRPGEMEGLKLGVHLIGFGLAVTCFGYNAAAWLARRERHLAVNAVAYLALAEFERRNVQQHWRERWSRPAAN